MRSIHAAAVAAAVASPLAVAQTVSPFTETFDGGLSGFSAGTGAPAAFVENGNAFASNTLTLTEGGFGAITFLAANASNNPSGGAFIGDYAGSGITTVSFDVRHNADIPLTFALRLAVAANSPAVIVFSPLVVASSDDFTSLTFELDSSSDLFVPAGPPGTADLVLGAVGNLQLLVNVPDGAGGTTVTIDADNVSIIPAPGVGALAIGFGLAAARRRRNA